MLFMGFPLALSLYQLPKSNLITPVNYISQSNLSVFQEQHILNFPASCQEHSVRCITLTNISEINNGWVVLAVSCSGKKAYNKLQWSHWDVPINVASGCERHNFWWLHTLATEIGYVGVRMIWVENKCVFSLLFCLDRFYRRSFIIIILSGWILPGCMRTPSILIAPNNDIVSWIFAIIRHPVYGNLANKMCHTF